MLKSPNRTDIIPIGIIGIISGILGFALVSGFGPSGEINTPLENTPTSSGTQENAPSRLSPVSSNEPEGDKSPLTDDINEDQGSALPEVPPGPTPDGIALSGAPKYFKCWDTEGTEHKGQDCDRLTVLEKRLSTRLYKIAQCHSSNAPVDGYGILSLGIQVDFQKHTIKFWSGPSSQIANAAPIGKCVRRELAGLPLYHVNPKFEKYRLFITVELFDPEKRKEEIAKKKKRARHVSVIKDKVNVRETPVEGMPLGRISSDSKVYLLKKDKRTGWCHIITPNDKEGWIICDALGL